MEIMKESRNEEMKRRGFKRKDPTKQSTRPDGIRTGGRTGEWRKELTEPVMLEIVDCVEFGN